MWLRVLWLVVASCLFTQSALAQKSEQDLARANRAAMEAYSRLEVTEARAQLEAAAQNARSAGIRGPALARTYANLGVVCVGGLNDNAAGLVAFRQALDEDRNVAVDPLFNAPNIEQVFALAKASSKSAGGATQTSQNAAASVPGRFESTLLHNPATEQLTQTALPVYVANAELGAAKMQVFYRGLGMRSPKSAEMQRTRDGFAYLIPCTAVFEPQVEYWISAIDEDGKVVGHAGKADAPIVVPVVGARTRPAPALPGQPAPAQCGTDECPPGMPGCEDVGDGSAGLGDTCSTQGDCGEGLVCRDDFCAIDEGSSSEGAGQAAARNGFFIDIGFSVGVAPVGSGHPAESKLPQSLADEAAAQPAEPREYLKRKGWACRSRTNMSGQPEFYDCKVHVENSGLVPTLAGQLELGYRFNQKVYASIVGRVQLERGDGLLAGIVLGARGGYVLLDQGAMGYAADVFGGIGGGQIQPQVVDNGPFAASGLVAVEVGARGMYRFTDGLSVVLSPHLYALFPTFLVNLDLTAGARYAF